MRKYVSALEASLPALLSVSAILALILAPSALPAQGPPGYTIELLDLPPGALARDMNARNEVVGDFFDGWGGFLHKDGVTEMVEYPGADGSALFSINDSGTVFGIYTPDITGPERYGFSRDTAGVFTEIVYPGSVTTRLQGANNDGAVVGYIEQPSIFLGTTFQGFVMSPLGAVTDLTPPDSILTVPIGINETGLVSGFYLSIVDFAFHGFTYKNGVYTVVDYPGAVGSDVVRTNNRGDLIGEYSFEFPTLDDWTPYLRTKRGDLYDLSYPDPGTLITAATSITDRGDILATALVFDPMLGAPFFQSFIWRK